MELAATLSISIRYEYQVVFNNISEYVIICINEIKMTLGLVEEANTTELYLAATSLVCLLNLYYIHILP